MNSREGKCCHRVGCSFRHASNLFVCLAVLLVTRPIAANALILGQIDDFQDGTAQNWGTGQGPADNVPNGGPTGSGDSYLQYTSSGGSGSDSRMVVFNSNQWQGDYNDAGIGSVAMDLNNFTAQPLSIRLAFFLSRTTGFVTTTPISLAADSGWQHATFALTAANFTAIGSPGDFGTLLSNFTGQLRILDSSSPSLAGDSVSATLGIDNVQAIPEPGTLALVAVGLVMLFCANRVAAAATATLRGKRTRRSMEMSGIDPVGKQIGSRH
ncbi:MAG TPA: hypothetical protein VL486_00210 [Verrucomicrobiae bacterium]|nr:hypothetical protein [Verrucomicrobiae bacterium]